MKCKSCNIEADWLERINAPGEDGIFYCVECVDDHKATIEQLRNMSREELENVPYTLVKWDCSGKKCNNGTKVRDYGAYPWYYRATANPKWYNITTKFWSCSRCNKFCKRLLKNYHPWSVYEKLFNLVKQRITKI